MSRPRGADAYRKVQVESSSPADLVVLLYDGALRFSAEARAAILRRDVKARAAAVSRALAIVGELRSSLDMTNGGEIAVSLDRLYEFVVTRLMDASFKQEVGPLDEAVTVLTNLRGGWVEAAAQARGNP